MTSLKVKIVNSGEQELPAYETPGAAGMDVRAAIKEPITLKPLQRILIPTGLSVQLPQGYQLEVRPRSGLALKYGITVLNTPGTVDADYRGEIKVILINLSDTDFVINPGERICQFVVTTYTRVEWETVTHLDHTVRGDGSFGHTGLN
ncbi:MAG: dUTP diphosphatase [Muribaculaceae bacterium]|nr:dUTP diphosphatase [Muribaculaceae bacterium]